MTASAHRYWRLAISSTVAGTAAGFAEIELRAYVGSTDLTGAGTVSASSQYDAVTYPVTNSVDNNAATAWNTAISGPDVGAWWWQYDFGAGNAYEVGQISITATATAGGGTVAPGTWNVQYSDNGSSWTNIRSLSGITWTDGETKTFAIAALRDHIESTGATEAQEAATKASAGDVERAGAIESEAVSVKVAGAGVESAGASESQGMGLQSAFAQSDAAAGAEVQSAFQGYAITQSDALGAADYYASALGFTGSSVEVVGASETQAADLFSLTGTTHAMGQTEAVGASDVCAATLLRPASRSTRPTAPAWWLRHRKPGRLWPS